MKKSYRKINSYTVCQIVNFGKQTPHVHLIIIRDWPKNSPTPPPPPHLKNLDNFPPSAFYSTLPAHTIRQKRVATKVLRCKEWATNRLTYVTRHNDVNNMTPLHPLLYVSFPDFRQNPQFSEKCFKCPWQQNSKLHLWRTA